MELDLNKALLLSFLSILALSFPSRAAAVWLPGRNLSVAAVASPPCGVGEAGCRIADLQPELEGIADPGMLGASLATGVTDSALYQNNAGRGRKSPNNGRYTSCATVGNKQRPCVLYCRHCGAC